MGGTIDPSVGINLDDAAAFWTWVAENQDNQFFVNYRSKNGHDWVDEDLKALLVFLLSFVTGRPCYSANFRRQNLFKYI